MVAPAVELKIEPKSTLLRLDLGCGDNKKEGFHGVDIAKTPSVDTIHDLRVVPWPFEDESVEEVHSSHFFEHLTGPERMKFMDELWRVMIVDGKATFIMPYYAGMRAVQDPTHQWPPVCEASFLYFNKKWRDDNKLSHYPISCDFDFSYGYGLFPDYQGKSEQTVHFAVAHYINVSADLQVTLTKRAASKK